MDRLIRECQSIVELNRIIDRGLDDETYQLAMDRLFELVLEGERNDCDAERATPAGDAGIVSPENTAEMDDLAATTSAGATSFVDVINSMDDIDDLNRIIDEDNWTTEASGVAIQRILELAGVEDFDEMIRNWSTAVNEEMQGDNMAGGDNPIDLDQNVPMTTEGERKRSSDEPVDSLRNDEPEGAISDNGGEELRVDDVQEGENSSYYESESTRSKHVKKFNATEVDYRLRLKNLDETFATLRHHGRRVGTPQRRYSTSRYGENRPTSSWSR